MYSVITGNAKDLGDGFKVLRILPHLDARSIGPFVFVDHFGPVPVKTGRELAVRPHPHIGLATVTYLYDGTVLHKDSLGSSQLIQPGEVNWMTAGRGIVHSEHSQFAGGSGMLEGIQTWIALPVAHEETEPAFEHYESRALPEIIGSKWKIRLIAGELMGKTSPVKILSSLFYGDLIIETGAAAEIEFPPERDAAIYVARGAITHRGATLGVGQMLVCNPGETVVVNSAGGARAIVLGGEKYPESRHLWWNFVSSSRARIEKAKNDWRANAMGTVAGESDRIPLPE